MLAWVICHVPPPPSPPHLQKQQQAQAEKLAAQLGALREERQQREQLEGTVSALQQRVAALQAERPEGG
jgi:polyhydroxyalkanoate synthesis regulator phasin